MRGPAIVAASLFGLASIAWTFQAGAREPALASPSGLRVHFGVDAAARLMRSPDADERLRGIERAAAIRSYEALLLLERAARASGSGGLDPRLPEAGIARRDPRALLAVVRALADFTDDEGARATIDGIVRADSGAFATHPPAPASARASPDPAADDAAGAEVVTLAREEAAVALAASGNSLALERLVTAARSGGAGQEAALVALSVDPPSRPLALGGVALATPATIALAARIGDLRTLDAILGIVRASDPALRAAAMIAMSEVGDTRAADVARASLHDNDVRVRASAAEALARLATADAVSAVEALVLDDATAIDGLRIAQRVQGEGIVRAAAARALATADPALRAAALQALGRQSSPSAVEALVTLAGMPWIEGDAACALARSPSADALVALERLATSTRGRRLAARAYLVRRYVRGDRSARLDALLATLTDSADPVDRAVGTQALVTLGERTLDAGLSDPDAKVRRAAAMGALGTAPMDDPKVAVRAQTERDEATREVLAFAWTKGAPRGVSTTELAARAQGGGPDAPAAAFALAERSEGVGDARVDALLHSRDPLLRAHVARGLGASAAEDATGRLAAAYSSEGDAEVRRAIVAALSLRAVRALGTPPTRQARGFGTAEVRNLLRISSRLDPDAVVRGMASDALRGRRGADAERWPSAGPHPGAGLDVAWLRWVPAEGATSTSVAAVTGLLATSDGAAIPIVFDDDGYALVAGVPAGEARLRLAPRLPPYSASGP